MSEAGVPRLVMTSSRAIVATRPRLLLSLIWIIFREGYADLARAEGMIQISNLDWSIVRSNTLTDKPFTGRVYNDFEPNATGGGWNLPRADFAMTFLDVVENSQMVHKAVGVCGA